MDQNQYPRVREIFERLARIPAHQRAAELDNLLPPGDPNRSEVEQLLAASDALAQQPDRPSRDPNETLTSMGGGPPKAARPVAVVPLAVGQLLAGRYRLERLLGAGGFSQAYLAINEQLHGKQVVVKIPLRNSNESSEWFARHFTDEIRALAALNHPGIVHVLDSAADPVHGEFFTEQFVEGPTLSELLKKGPPLGLERSARMLERVSRALAAAHAKGVVHRDLKPQNILVHMPGTHEETPVLIDFGIASLLGPTDPGGAAEAIETRVAGTPDYLAPEQALGRVLPESDIYALGCIAVELLTGERLNARLARRPPGELPEHAAAVMLSEKMPELPEAIRARLAKLTTIDPANRGSAAGHAGGLFRELLAPPLDAISTVPPGNRRTWIAGAFAAAVGTRCGLDGNGPPADRSFIRANSKEGPHSPIKGEAGGGERRRCRIYFTGRWRGDSQPQTTSRSGCRATSLLLRIRRVTRPLRRIG